MELFKNFFKGKKINANEIAFETNENKYILLDKYLQNRKFINLYSSDIFEGNIILEKSASDFSVFIIETDGNSYKDFVKKQTQIIIDPDGKTISHNYIWWNSSNKQMYTVAPQIIINDNTISIINNMGGTVAAANAYNTEQNIVKITNIWGVKK